jgi:hypothetical protein
MQKKYSDREFIFNFQLIFTYMLRHARMRDVAVGGKSTKMDHTEDVDCIHLALNALQQRPYP